MKSKLLSSFLGGFLGILLSGYAYYLSGKHYFFLVPVGAFSGSLMGFFWFNFRKITSKSLAFSQSLLKKKPVKILKLFIQLLGWISSIKIRFKAKDLSTFFIIIYRSLKQFAQIVLVPFKRIFCWIKAHPMNFYSVQEVIIFLIISTALSVLLIRMGVFSNPLSELGFFAGILLFGVTTATITTIIEKGERTFYSDWQFYSRFGFLGVVLKTISRFLLFAILISVGLAVIGAGVLLAVMYGIILLILSFLFIGVIGIFLYVLRLANSRRELFSLIITMIVTFISYFIYRNSFVEEIIIWLVAFSTGSISSLAVWLVLSFDRGLIIKKLEKAYLFLSSNDSDMEKVVTYKQDWIGVMVFMPGNWAINNIYGQIMKGGEYLGDIVYLRMR
ncbi:MAG: hypothetical protein PHP37_04140 [Patescibacteria group bacterium]|nr:hypothetical protein [Patescibacteria group bacterium]